MSINEFVHLHCHTQNSNLDAMPSVSDYLYAVAIKKEGKAIAVTEHGNMRSIIEFYRKATTGEIKYANIDLRLPPIKPIFGIEFYVTPLDLKVRGNNLPDDIITTIKKKTTNKRDANALVRQYQFKMGLRNYYHLLAFAKNAKGLHNLLCLNHISWKHGFYYRPRIDLKTLKRYSEGLIVTTACCGGYIPSFLLCNNFDRAIDYAKTLKEIFKEDFYIEIQPHKFKDQIKVNKRLIEIAEHMNVDVVGTNDCHYIDKDDSTTHEVLLAIQTKSTLKAEDRFVFNDSEFYMKSREEMFKSFKGNHPGIGTSTIIKALDNTVEIANKVENFSINLDVKRGLLPKIFVPKEFKNANDYFFDLCNEKFSVVIDKLSFEFSKRKNIDRSTAKKKYTDRFKTELNRIIKLGFSGYFLVIYDLINYANDNGIIVGPGRGSAAGSLVSYILGITKVDPILYDLSFDRFLNEDRIDLPDIDLDFPDTERDKLFLYLQKKYGEKNTGRISTTSKLQGRQCILDVARVYGVPVNETFRITKLIEQKVGKHDDETQIIESSFNNIPACKEYAEKYPDVVRHAIKLEGNIRQVGIHPCGFIISPFSLEKFTPVEYRNVRGRENVKVVALDYREVQQLGLLKIDLLGLKTLRIIQDVVEQTGIVLDDITDVNDKSVLQGFNDGNTIGVFQFDSVGMRELLKATVVDTFDDIIALNALYRPGTMRSGVWRAYVERRVKHEQKAVHRIFDEITGTTFGVILFQEQLTKVLVELADFSYAEADKVRKMCAKSSGRESFRDYEVRFVDAAVNKGMEKKVAKNIFSKLITFGEYAFNKSHATAYSLISYWCMWLKLKYPVEFFSALLRSEQDSDKKKKFAIAARDCGIKLFHPDINFSVENFVPEPSSRDAETGIRAGIMDIKNVGQKAADEIINNQPYKSFSDFVKKVNRRVVNKKIIYNLIVSDAFESIGLKKETLLETTNDRGDKVWERMLSLSDDESAELYAEYDTDRKFSKQQIFAISSDISPIPLDDHPVKMFSEFINRFDFVGKHKKISDIDWNEKYVYTVGILNEVKYKSVDVDKKKFVTDSLYKLAGGGKQYGSMIIADDTGALRIRLEHTHLTMQKILTKSNMVAVLLSLYKPSKTAAIVLAADFIKMKNVYESCLGADNTMREFYKQSNFIEKYLLYATTKLIRRKTKIFCIEKYIARNALKFPVIALIGRVKYHITKNNKLMAFAELFDESGCVNVVIWPEVLEYRNNTAILKPGMIVKLFLMNKNGFFIDKHSVVAVAKVF